MSLDPGLEPVAFGVPWPGWPLESSWPQSGAMGLARGVARVFPSVPYMVLVREIMNQWMIHDSDGNYWLWTIFFWGIAWSMDPVCVDEGWLWADVSRWIMAWLVHHATVIYSGSNYCVIFFNVFHQEVYECVTMAVNLWLPPKCISLQKCNKW